MNKKYYCKSDWEYTGLVLSRVGRYRNFSADTIPIRYSFCRYDTIFDTIFRYDTFRYGLYNQVNFMDPVSETLNDKVIHAAKDYIINSISSCTYGIQGL